METKLAEAVSLSLQRLQAAKSIESWGRLAFATQPERRHQPSRFRELARIPSVLRDCLDLAAQGKLHWPLYVHGGPGNGKTCGGLAIADHVTGSDWFTFEEFTSKTNDVKFGRLSYRTGGEWNQGGGYRELSHEVVWTNQRWWASLTTKSLVIIDDIGTRGQASEASYEAFKGLLDTRTDKPVIVTSNHDIAVMATIFDPRVFDRLASGTVVELAGESRR